MRIENYYFSKRQTIILVVLIIGLFIGLSLVQKEQIVKSRASVANNTLEIFQNTNPPEPAICQENSCITKTLSLLIKPKVQSFNEPIAAVITLPSLELTSKEFTLSCPIEGEYNTCSHFDDPRDPCHCNPSQYDPTSMVACRNYPSLKYGIDIGTKANKTVTIPYIIYQGHSEARSIACTLASTEGVTCPKAGCEPQQILHYSCQTQIGQIYLLFSHIKANPGKFPTYIASGQPIGEVAKYGGGLRRLNVQLGVGGDCTGGNTSVCKRGGEAFQCPLRKDPGLDY